MRVCEFVCVCVCVCLSIFKCVCYGTRESMFECMWVGVCVCVYVCAWFCVRVCACVWAGVFSCATRLSWLYVVICSSRCVVYLWRQNVVVVVAHSKHKKTTKTEVVNFVKLSSINDVTQFWKFLTPSPLSRFLLLRPYYCCHKIFEPFLLRLWRHLWTAPKWIIKITFNMRKNDFQSDLVVWNTLAPAKFVSHNKSLLKQGWF